MSKVKEIQKLIFNNFDDGNIHTVSEIKQLALEKGIIKNVNDSAIHNTIFSLKNNPLFKTVGKGEYRIINRNNEEDNDMSVEKAFEYLIRRMKEIDRTTAFNSNSIEFDEAKKDALVYKKYLEVLNKTINK